MEYIHCLCMISYSEERDTLVTAYEGYLPRSMRIRTQYVKSFKLHDSIEN